MARKEHPADQWTSKLVWHNRKDQSEAIQVIDLLHDIRLLLLVIVVLIWLGN